MKRFPKILGRIIAALKEARSVAIVGHVRPDGDCVGSQLALAEALAAQGKEIVCWNEDAIPQKLAFLDPGKRLQPPAPGRSFDVVVALDAASLERLGSVAPFILERQILANIDHHASNTRFGDLNWINPRSPSTGELVFQLLKAAGWPITPPIADCLFAAISTDTGSFQYDTTRPTTLYCAGELVHRGANLARISDEIYQSYPLSRVRLLQHVFNHFRLTHHNQIGYFWLKPADFTRTGTASSDSEGLIDHIRAIEPVVVACMFEQVEPEIVRISLRSKSPRLDVNAIARQFGGGGHHAAAGARIAGRPLSVQRRVVNAIRKALDQAGQSHAHV
ncbi:MAG TPA: bifunctional oligoribonuclease/PAP phosphatase NrnA [Candidatus Paceibacterota bacterium]|nr:bifunctional oligoribonuclease/PAP phosphatase NrnA [Verrucomicrobiota bacterium]HOX02066.1 bifunctional oligoribonuclease/PAP phosphatase NrnA [Verrucomicrobiota bacterium]HRZ45310.1 bifunctional oligoribonuclease/PAP phosphatase NrnA [Candidatus Paceibacterota bacterium]HRZ94418.1 bifunctional oligoribonuclease/PAP phosphatase NrnA [Candidatus Paceibacterota bacterium]